MSTTGRGAVCRARRAPPAPRPHPVPRPQAFQRLSQLPCAHTPPSPPLPQPHPPPPPRAKPGARLTHEADPLPLLDLPADVLEHLLVLEGFGNLDRTGRDGTGQVGSRIQCLSCFCCFFWGGGPHRAGVGTRAWGPSSARCHVGGRWAGADRRGGAVQIAGGQRTEPGTAGIQTPERHAGKGRGVGCGG